MKNIITISRQFGAGGGEIGRKVADRLGYYYCDRDMIIHSAMQDKSLPKDLFRIYDEKLPFSLGFGQSLFDFYNRPLSESLFNAQKKAIMEIGEKRSCVIVGRNANVILKEFDHSLHVFIAAEQYFRIRRMRERMPDVSDDEIIERIKTVDKKRKKYCSYYTNTVFGDASAYDLCLKSSTLGIETSVDLICNIAKEEA